MNNMKKYRNISVGVDNNILMDLFELEKYEYLLKDIYTEIGIEMYGLLKSKYIS